LNYEFRRYTVAKWLARFSLNTVAPFSISQPVAERAYLAAREFV
jgi:hypothetical protein